MRSIVIFSILLAVTSSTELNLCEDNDPRCTFVRPNVLPGTLVRVQDEVGDSYCLCPRGQLHGELCITDDECAIGTYCGAPIHSESHHDPTKGICTDRCKGYHCPEFHACRLNSTGGPECHGFAYQCTNAVNVQVCAIDHSHEGKIETYYNMCYFVNENFERERTGAEELQRIDCVTKAIVHGH